jgi:acyl-[acyl-carrier-protein]-phospholipid O-acyltransferase / long-chain-fatty-acid--[acyl-carrier-protein] ligase
VNTWTTYTLVAIAIVAAIFGMGYFLRRRFVRGLFRVMLGILYRTKVIGLDNLPKEGGCVVISNHVSYVDGILILWLLPRNVRFVVDGGNFIGPLARYLASAFDTILMMANPKSIGRALKEAREGLIKGDVIGIFPEGTLSRTGQLQAFKPGLTKILKGTTAPVVPMHLEGMWGSIFSFSGGKFFFKKPQKLRRTITLHIGKPLPTGSTLDQMRSAVAALGADANIYSRQDLGVPARRVIRAWKRRGSRLQIADSLGNEASGRQMLVRVLALRRVLRREILTDDETSVGVLLPPSLAGVAVNVAMAIDRRVTANLNYTATSEVINHCTAAVGIRHILTSEKFMEKMDFKLDTDVVILESLKDKVTKVDKAIAFLMATLLPAGLLIRVLGAHKIESDDLLTVIFTSGSTGMPKGVELTNANIAHNIEAIDRAVRLNQEDVVLGILPFFHSFGYSVTLWASNCLGPASVYHFNPLDARQVGKMAEKYGATVLLGTPTFLRGYVRRIEPEQFKKLDVVVVGAEKMPADLFEAFEKRFGVRPVEGYGATELSPLVSVNIPPSRSSALYQADRAEGSVGRPVPGVSAKIISPETGEELASEQDGMLMVRGPNLMRGYSGDEKKTNEVIRDGWYTTGDIAHLDKEGFIHITGRLSRFSKIGGEMVPHVRVEEEIEKLGILDESDLPRVAVTAVPCEKKGERLIVLHTGLDRSIDEIRKGLSAAGLPNLFIPSDDSFIEVDVIPVLGTGKLDLKALKDKAAAISG